MNETPSFIEAKETNIRDLLRNRFFEIPIYQRPLSWNQDNFQDFVEDIKDALESGETNYFLGTILLKGDKNSIFYEVVDGQQRLTSLMVLLAVFRDNLNDQQIQKWLVEEGDKYAGIPTRERIKVWKDLEEVFSEYVYKMGGTVRLI